MGITELPGSSSYHYEPQTIEAAPSAPPASSYGHSQLSDEPSPVRPTPPLPADVRSLPLPGPLPTIDDETTSHSPKEMWPDPFSEPLEAQQRLLPPQPAPPKLFRRMQNSFKRITEPAVESDSQATHTNRHKSVRGAYPRTAQKRNGRTKTRQAAGKANYVVLQGPKPESRPQSEQGWSVDWSQQIVASVPQSLSTSSARTQNSESPHWPHRGVPSKQRALPVSGTIPPTTPVFVGPLTPDPTLYVHP